MKYFSDSQEWTFSTSGVSPIERRPLIRIGAELGDRRMARWLGSDTWPNPLSGMEKTYWKLVSLGGESLARDPYWEVNLHFAMDGINVRELLATLARSSPMSGLVPPASRTLPGRGLLATFFTDSMLRREYGFNYGKHAPGAGMRPAETLSTLEMFRFHRATRSNPPTREPGGARYRRIAASE